MFLAGHMPHLPRTPKPRGTRVPDRRHRIDVRPKTGDVVKPRTYTRTDGNFNYA